MRPATCLATLVLVFTAALTVSAVEAPAAPTAPVILLKLDDLSWDPKNPDAAVSGRWKQIADYLEGKNLKASFGILCESLATDHPAYIAWLKERQTKGLIELWNHGYNFNYKADPATGAKGAFEGTPLEVQRDMLIKGQQLFREKIGGDMHAFGPHVCHLDGTTYTALEAIPEITMVWFYGPPKGVTTGKFVFKRTINLESPIFVPNPAEVQEQFLKTGKHLPYIAMQGHPNQWNAERFQAFTATIDFLVAQGCTFMSPSAFLATQKRPAAP
jgi:peptidoglycan/xylan/chitin deacetylase (PgdA/CDA1 family)